MRLAPPPTSRKGGGSAECSRPVAGGGRGEGAARLNDRLPPPPPAAGDPDAVRHHRHQLRGDPVRTRRTGRTDDRRTARQGRSLVPARRRHIGVRRHRHLSRRARPRPAHRRRHQEDVRLRQAAADTLRRHGRRLSALRLRPQLLPRPDRAATHSAEDAGIDLARSVVHAAGVLRLHPSRHRQGGAQRQPLRSGEQRRRAGRLCHPELPVRHPAGRAVRRRQLLSLVPAARPYQRGRRQLEPARRASPTTRGTRCCRRLPWWRAASPA